MTNFKIDSVIVYPRKSREDVEREKITGEDSLKVMTDMLISTCDRFGIDNRIIMSEIGSADTIEGRPVFSSIINSLLPSGKYQGIVVREISRLGRGNFADAGRIYETIITNKIYIITPNRVYDPLNSSDLRFIRMELFMAREEYEMTKERLWYGKDARGKQGYAANYLPVLGLRSTRGKFELIPDEIETLHRIFQMRANRISFNEISNMLNDEGIKSKKGLMWSPTSIRQITNNKRYIGIATWNGEEIPAQHPPLIDIELWNKVQEVNKERAIKSNRADNPYLVELWCHDCGNRMYGTVRKSNGRKRADGTYKLYNTRVIYECDGRKGFKCRNYHLVDFVNNSVVGELKRLFELDIWNDLAGERDKLIKGENLESQLESRKRQLKEKEAFLIKLENDYTQGLPFHLYTKHHEQTERQITALQQEINKIENGLRQRKEIASSTEIKLQLKSIVDRWDTLANKEKKILLRTIFPRIEVSKSGEFYITRQIPESINI